MGKDKKKREKSIRCDGKELKEPEQKPITDSYYTPSPQYMPSFEDDTVTPALMDTLVPAPDPQVKEDEKFNDRPIEEEDKDTELG